MFDSLQLIPAADDAAWRRWLGPAPHDFYHTAAYHRFSEESGEGEAWLAVYGRRERFLAWPYLLRRVEAPAGLDPSPWRDVTSVYGYPGPLACGCRPGDAFLQTARRAIAGLWRSLRVVSVFTRFHPLFENHNWAEPAGRRPNTGGARAAGTTVSLDLTLDESANWRHYQAGLRNRIHRGRRLGLSTEPDESWEHLEDFVRLYHATMQRNHASSCYLFGVDYFRRLRRALAPHIFLLLTRSGSALAAAGIFVEHDGKVENLFSMNNEAFLDLAPTKVLLDDVRRWARARGNRVFHLGGGRGGREDSLFAFKAAFSPRRHRFYTGSWILNEPIYQRLCEARREAGQLSQDYFPAYRAPLPAAPIPPAAMTANCQGAAHDDRPGNLGS